MRSTTALLLCLLISFTWAATSDANTTNTTNATHVNTTGDHETLFNFIGGLYSVVNLPDPKDVMNCYTEKDKTDTVIMIGAVLKDLNNDRLNDAQAKIDKYTANLPPATKTCLNNSPENIAALKAYKIWGIPASEAKAKIMKYMITNFIGLKIDIKRAHDDWFANKPRPTGVRAGELLKKIFVGGKNVPAKRHHGKHARHIEDTDFEIVQHFMTGFFSIVNLPEPKTVVQCLNAQGQHDAAVLIGAVLKDLDNNNIKGADEKLDKFMNNLPKETKDCWDNNAELTAALKAYKVYGQPASAVKAKVVVYVITHIIQLKIEIKKANEEWNAGKHTDVGKRFGNLLKKIF